MRRLVLLSSCVALACLVPSLALAQPPPPPPPAPAPAPLPPADPNAPPPAPAPAPAPAPPPAPPPPAGSYYQPVQPVYAPPPEPQTLHRSMTFELNLGLGWISASADGNSETSDLGVGGLSLGIGGWLNPKLAITGRLAGVTLSDNGAQLSNIFLGPSVQYWIDNHFWLGGGAGLGILAISNDGAGGDDSVTGFGLDLRVGYTFNEGSENTINASLELNPGFFSENGSSATFTGIGILLGYQHL